MWYGVGKTGGREEKRKVMEAKKKLRGRRERIEDDLTEEERKIRWRLERVAEVERERGRKVHVGYMKMWVDGSVRTWDELGEKWNEKQGNGGSGDGGMGKGIIGRKEGGEGRDIK